MCTDLQTCERCGADRDDGYDNLCRDCYGAENGPPDSYWENRSSGEPEFVRQNMIDAGRINGALC